MEACKGLGQRQQASEQGKPESLPVSISAHLKCQVQGREWGQLSQEREAGLILSLNKKFRFDPKGF